MIEYGSPFPDDATQLRESPIRNCAHVVTIGPSCLEMWIVDIVRSAKSIESDALPPSSTRCAACSRPPASGGCRACLRFPTGSVLACAATYQTRIF